VYLFPCVNVCVSFLACFCLLNVDSSDVIVSFVVFAFASICPLRDDSLCTDVGLRGFLKEGFSFLQIVGSSHTLVDLIFTFGLNKLGDKYNIAIPKS